MGFECDLVKGKKSSGILNFVLGGEMVSCEFVVLSTYLEEIRYLSGRTKHCNWTEPFSEEVSLKLNLGVNYWW